MGSFVINGSAQATGPDNVDPRLIEIMRAAASQSPYDVELFSGKRNSGGGSRHDHGKAVDMVLIDSETGAKIPNLGAGGKAFEAYETFAKSAREVQTNRYPELKNTFRWGGYFGPSNKNPGGADLMHFDTRPDGAMSQGSWAGGLNTDGKKLVAALGPGRAWSSTERVKGVMPDVLRTGSITPSPPSRSSNLSDEQRNILALTVLGESSGEGREGMEAVASVIKNRVSDPRFGNDPAKVAKQKSQFSTWNEGKGGNKPEDRFSPDDPIYQEALAAVDDVFAGRIADPTSGATHYFAPNIVGTPKWFNTEASGGSKDIGNHRFAVPKTPPATAIAAIDNLAETDSQPQPDFGFAPIPPARPNGLGQANQEPRKQYGGGMSFLDKFRLRNAPKVLGAGAQGVTKVASAFGDAGASLARGAQQFAQNRFDEFTAPSPERPQVPASLSRRNEMRAEPSTTNRFDFSGIPQANPALQQATNAAAARLAPQQQFPTTLSRRNEMRAEPQGLMPAPKMLNSPGMAYAKAQNSAIPSQTFGPAGGPIPQGMMNMQPPTPQQPVQQQQQQQAPQQQQRMSYRPPPPSALDKFNASKIEINKRNPFTGDKYKDRDAQSIRSAQSVQKAIELGLYKRPSRR